MSLVVDLRSDTVTQPTLEMKEAMFSAKVGDDVLGDDPSVMELESLAAELTGKEAAVYVPSGTMGNQIAIASSTERGDSILAEEEAHILYYEVAGPAIFAGVVTRTVPSHHGVMDPKVIEDRIMERSLHTPGTSLICLENTHNRAGGTITPVETMKEIKAMASRRGIRVHLDGARVFNAAVALGIPVKQITDQVDSVNFCLSKGLRAPVGSVLCSDRETIGKARVWRKRLGGGMRQAGILAAAGIYSLKNYVDRLAEDHHRTHKMAQFLSNFPHYRIDPHTVQTNILMVGVPENAASWAKKLGEKGIKCFPFTDTTLRLVFHADVDDQQLAHAMEVFEQLARES